MQERTNGLALTIAGSNQKGTKARRSLNTGLNNNTVLLPVLRKTAHATYRERRMALAKATAVCEAAGVAAMRVSYELLVQQPRKLQVSVCTWWATRRSLKHQGSGG